MRDWMVDDWARAFDRFGYSLRPSNRRHECRRSTLTAQCRMVFSLVNNLHKLWGGPPGPRPTPPSAWLRLDETDRIDRRAGPGGPARTRGSAPQFMQDSQFQKNYAALGYN